MDEKDRRQTIIATLKRQGFRNETGSSAFSFVGQIYVGNNPADIRIEIGDTQFSELPKISIPDRSQLPKLTFAHVEAFNKICYANIALLRLDPANPGGSVLRVIEEAKKALETSLAGNAETEIAKEYPRYWDGNLIYIPGTFRRQVTEGKIGYMSPSGGSKQLVFQPNGTKHLQFQEILRHAVWIPVEHEIVPQDSIIQPKTIEELNKWWTGNRLRQFFGLPKVHSVLLDDKIILIAAPNAIVGFRLEPSGALKALKRSARVTFLKKHLANQGNHEALVGYVGVDSSASYCASRNTASEEPPLLGKNIAVLGCGTIGSHLARYLVQNGAAQSGRLVLVDNDIVSPGNLGRHLLNFEDIGKNKALALAQELERFHPEISCQPLHSRVQDVWRRVQSCDLIIDATGVENVSEYLNLQGLERRATGKQCNILHVFLWHNGIAAQSFLNIGRDLACYRCLRPDQQWSNDPRKDKSSEPEIVVNRCGDGPYLPFSVSASVSAAALGLEATLDFFNGKIGPHLRSRTLDFNLAKQLKDSRPKPSSTCPICQQ